MTSNTGSKLALLHRVKDRKTPSLSAQASFKLFSLKVAWSGKSLIILSSLSFNVKRIVVGLLKWYDCTDCKHT